MVKSIQETIRDINKSNGGWWDTNFTKPVNLKYRGQTFNLYAHAEQECSNQWDLFGLDTAHNRKLIQLVESDSYYSHSNLYGYVLISADTDFIPNVFPGHVKLTLLTLRRVK